MTKCQAYLPAVLGLHVRGVETPVGEKVLDEDGGSKKYGRYNLAPFKILGIYSDQRALLHPN